MERLSIERQLRRMEAVILQRSKSERRGQTLELEEVFVMHFREGKISEMWYVPVDQAAFDAWIG